MSTKQSKRGEGVIVNIQTGHAPQVNIHSDNRPYCVYIPACIEKYKLEPRPCVLATLDLEMCRGVDGGITL